MGELLPGRRVLGRIRCFRECLACYKRLCDFPPALCYTPKLVEYKCLKAHTLNCFAEPSGAAVGIGPEKTSKLQVNTASKIFASGEEYVDSTGQWIKVYGYDLTGSGSSEVRLEKAVWVFLRSLPFTCDSNDQAAISTPSLEAVASGTDKSKHAGVTRISSWLDVVEVEWSIMLYRPPSSQSHFEIAEADADAVTGLAAAPPSWTPNHDDELVTYLSQNVEVDSDMLCVVKNYVESIDVSTASDGDGEDNLIDGDDDTYWESDGNHGQHWIRLKMKRGTIISKLIVTLDSEDDNYLPEHIQVLGGDADSLKVLNDVQLNLSFEGMHDECILENMTSHHPVVEIRVKHCKDDGIDTRIHNVKLISTKERFCGLIVNNFCSDKLVRFPKLQNYDKRVLYRRAQCLQRFVALLDSVLSFLIPQWDYSVGSLDMIQDIKHLLPLSRRRTALIDTFIKETETARPSSMPKLYINRRLAAEHKSDPSLDPEGTSTVFHQIYEGLKPRERDQKLLDYRWPTHYPQWWECKFVSEGIIDQGGGFRDSLCDVADELCPGANDVPLPLSFFVRSPNQLNAKSNVLRDAYVPNSSCHKLAHYRWIGQLMGACLRGKERLVLSFPSYIWKRLTGEKVAWSQDFASVDADEVRLLEDMASMDEDTFSVTAEERTWTTTLSNGETVELREGGASECVRYEERGDYIRAVQEARMSEANEQIDAIRQGFLSVAPQAVTSLLTWQEVEKRVCGDPDITIDALKKSVHYEDVDANDESLQYLWEALTNFSNEDRSRFLRFVTGRRRLPCPLYICPNKSTAVDSLPESSTCSNTLYLPKYSNPKVAEEKLRYAAYNCVAIDTDVSPWDE